MSFLGSIHELGILRAAAERRPLDTYLGSTLALEYYRALLVSRGLLDMESRCTRAGKALAAELQLSKQPRCRAYLWPLAEQMDR